MNDLLIHDLAAAIERDAIEDDYGADDPDGHALDVETERMLSLGGSLPAPQATSDRDRADE